MAVTTDWWLPKSSWQARTRTSSGRPGWARRSPTTRAISMPAWSPGRFLIGGRHPVRGETATEDAALAELAPHFQAGTVPLQHMLDDREAQAGAAGGAVAALVHPVEA